MTSLRGLADVDAPHDLSAGEGCITLKVGAHDLRPAAPLDALACQRSLPAAPREFKLQRGEFALKLAIVGGDERSLGTLRSALSFDHGLGWGPVAGWQLHADVFLDRLAGAGEGPAEEQAHLALARALPAEWNLRLTVESTARGGLDPGGAASQTSEIAAALSRSFRLGPYDREHRLNFKAAEQRHLDRLCGSDQRRFVTGLTYAHALDLGSLAAEAAYTHVETIGASPQAAARVQLRYSAHF